MDAPRVILKAGPDLTAQRLQQPIPLRPGQLVRVQVLQLGNGEARLELAGQTYTARGQLPAEPGRFWVLVESVQAGLIRLKLLPTATTSELPATDLYTALGLNQNEESEALVRALLRWRLPLEPNLIRRFMAEAEHIPAQEKPQYWAVRAWLQSLDLHLKPEGLKQALKYLLRHQDAAPEGQAQLNQAVPLAAQQEVVRFFTFRAKEEEGELYLIKERKEKGREQDLPRLVLRLSTRRWGDVWVSLAAQGRNLSARVLCADESLLHLAAAAEADLKDKLTKAGYNLTTFAVTKKVVGGVAELLTPLGDATYKRFDIST